ncbi:MAG: multifunctional 2',3'-cyclic-nucleotide 2'-phosphodiesterase/5'-nucleotidase/3'-nucleotidase [Myxococcales bacterium]|nr:multifunctional 2',3'-cyclic-nucleotide 2'-phosphodiesterase/5'-nucleotidase/3'-nucleotidase [Myxococcales bacterium]
MYASLRMKSKKSYLGCGLLIGLSLMLSGCLWEGAKTLSEGADLRLTVLHTSDIHSRLFPFELAPTRGDQNLGLNEANAPFGGVARLGYVLRRERERSRRVIHLDSGDCFQGAPIFNENFGAPELRFLSMIGLDAAVIGNHEFDAGVNNFTEQLDKWATFDVLGANYDYPDYTDPRNHDLGRMSQPYALYNLEGVKVAVIGMANLGSLSSIGEGGNSLSITPLEQNETVRSYVQLLHSSVDLIFVLTHLGLTEDQELITGYEKAVWSDRVPDNWDVLEDLGDGRVMAWVPGVRGIDAIIGGHLHVVLNPPKLVKDRDGREVPLVHSGAFAKFVGRLDLVVQDDTEFGGKKIASHKYQVFPVDDRLSSYEDRGVSEMLEPYLLSLNQHLDLRKVIAYAPKTILRRSATGNGDSGLGNLVVESMRSRRRVDAEVGVTNTLGIRDNFYAGPITLEDMFNVFPFENTITIMYLSGYEMQDLMNYMTERSASRGCQAQAQVAGVTFTMNCGQVLANFNDPTSTVDAAESILVNGQPLNPSATYKIATNNYIANGGSGFKVLKRNTTKQDTGVSMRDALIDYLQTKPQCGDYEENVAKWCDMSDEFSLDICAQVGRVGRIPGAENTQGAYADVPCVVSAEDGRIKRKTSVDLDMLPDEDETEAQE